VFEKKLSTVEQVALSLGFEPFDPAPYNALYNQNSGVLAIQTFRLPSRPNLELIVEYYPFGKGPYGGDERWFDVVLADGTVEGESEFRGIAREKLIKLVHMMRNEFGREFIIIRHPKIE